MTAHGPQRIVCLTEDPTEILCALGEEDRIVGISAYTVRPPGIEKRKPVVSAFTGGSVSKIQALDPDLVIGFSDVQADLAARLIRAHLPVLILNQRSLEEILETVMMIGLLVNQRERATALVEHYRSLLETTRKRAGGRELRPRVYFEEWFDPPLSAIQWVSELIEVAGGVNIFADRAPGKAALERKVSLDEVVARDPEVVIGCWCGKPFDPQQVRERPGFENVTAVRNQRLHEMDPAIILQPGPAAITAGLPVLETLLHP
jgi:iron complex transport system substrate-binding protein